MKTPISKKKHDHPLVYIANRFVYEFKKEYGQVTGIEDLKNTSKSDRTDMQRKLTSTSKILYEQSQMSKVITVEVDEDEDMQFTRERRDTKTE